MKILVVDDEPLARRRLCAQLEDLGMGTVVGEAEHGLAALAAVENLAPDVVLLDVRMPGMDGLEAARHLARLPHPPTVIFTTAYDEHALAAFEVAAIAYLLKPVRSNGSRKRWRARRSSARVAPRSPRPYRADDGSTSAPWSGGLCASCRSTTCATSRPTRAS